MARTINEELRNNRRRQIIIAATAIFAKYGYSESTIKEIAKESEISHASIFLYFENKEDLFQKVIIEHLDEAKEAYQTIFKAEGTSLLKIRSLMEGQIKRQLQNTNFIRLIHFVTGYPERFPILTDRLKQFVDEFINALRIIIEEGQRLEQINTGKSYYLAMAWFSYISGVGTSNLEYSEECCEELVMNGLRMFIREG